MAASQIAYNGHPLYYYVGDHGPGQTTGQGLNQFGALWYVLSPAGTAITTKAPATAPRAAARPDRLRLLTDLGTFAVSNLDRRTVLLTGATGYVGGRLLHGLEAGGAHGVRCLRGARRRSRPALRKARKSRPATHWNGRRFEPRWKASIRRIT